MHAFNAPYLYFCPSSDSKTELKPTSSLNKQTLDPDHAYSSMTRTLSFQTPTQNSSILPCQKLTSYRVTVVFSKPVHARGVWTQLNFTNENG